MDSGIKSPFTPVSIGGVTVNSGDLVVADDSDLVVADDSGIVVADDSGIVVADDSGIVVLSAARADEPYSITRAAEDRTPFVRRWLEGGSDLAELPGLSPAEVEALLSQRGW